jgi:hypothetical protein
MIDVNGEQAFFDRATDHEKNESTFFARLTVRDWYAGTARERFDTTCMFIGGRLRLFRSPRCWGRSTSLIGDYK